VRKRDAKSHWLASEIVRREACRLAIQNRYFSPEWFAEFKDYLHKDLPPFPRSLMEELCLIVAGTKTCDYCTRRRNGECILGLTETN
jgi:hypothetical protein